MEQANPHVVEVSPQTFQDLIARSRETVVLLYFWAEQVPVSVSMRDTLVALAGQYDGKFVLGTVDAGRDPMIAQQLQVRTVPSIKVVADGGLADELDGPQGERVLREFLDRLTMSSGELLREQLRNLLERGDYQSALGLLQQALAQEPNNTAFKVELADVLAITGDLDAARGVLATLGDDVEEVERPRERVALAEESETLEALEVLRARRDAGNASLDDLHALAVRAGAAGDYELALEAALELMLRDKTYRDELGRRTLIRLFKVLGKGNPLAKTYRRRMFAALH